RDRVEKACSVRRWARGRRCRVDGLDMVAMAPRGGPTSALTCPWLHHAADTRGDFTGSLPHDQTSMAGLRGAFRAVGRVTCCFCLPLSAGCLFGLCMPPVQG